MVEASGVAGHEPCRLDTTATLALLDPATGEPLAVDGNPVTGELRSERIGGPGGETGVGMSATWNGCAPGDEQDGRHDVTVEASIEGFGTFRGTAMTPRCESPGTGSTLRLLG
jgi:hypothetical protein